MKPVTHNRLHVVVTDAARLLGATTPMQVAALRTLVQEVIRIVDLDKSEPPPIPPQARRPRPKVQCGDCNGAGCPDCLYGEVPRRSPMTPKGFPPPPPGSWENYPTPVDPNRPR